MIDIYFDYQTAYLDYQSKNNLDKLSDKMKDDGNIQLLLWGFTTRCGGKEENLRLSEQRASTVVAYLESKGIDRNRLVVRGFGEEEQAIPTDEDIIDKRNDRVEIRRR